MRWPILIPGFLALSGVSLGQQFELVQPDGRVSGTATITAGELLVQDAHGRVTRFDREPRFDSPDRQYAGYHSVDLRRAMRFPRAGRGPIQIADLRVSNPRFRNAQQSVRPGRRIREHSRSLFESSPGYSLPYITPLPSRVSPYYDRYASGYRPPRTVIVDSRVIPHPALPPARLQLFNGGRRELQVGVVDLKNPQGTRSMRIGPGAVADVEIPRESGSQRVDQVRTISPYGDWITREIVRDVPPSVRYEIVVHEWAMQSVAIDRTGKSPNPIEDINFQGRGLGRFPLPPGELLASGRIDVYREAIGSGLQGTVAPIVPQQPPRDTASALERAVLDAQLRAQRGR